MMPNSVRIFSRPTMSWKSPSAENLNNSLMLINLVDNT